MDCGRISAGVPINRSTVGTRENARDPMIRDAAAMIYAELTMALFTSSFLPAPKSCAVTIPPPLLIPLLTEKKRNDTEPVAPTAASESLPSSFPTIIVSARLYACWKRFPRRSGNANKASNTRGLPSVMFFVRETLICSVPFPVTQIFFSVKICTAIRCEYLIFKSRSL